MLFRVAMFAIDKSVTYDGWIVGLLSWAHGTAWLAIRDGAGSQNSVHLYCPHAVSSRLLLPCWRCFWVCIILTHN